MMNTDNFDLELLQKTDGYDIEQFNGNMQIIDEEMAKPPLMVNNIEPDSETRNIQINSVPLADNLTSDEAQVNIGTYIIRTSGGESSIADGVAMLNDIKGNMVKTGYTPEVLNLSVTQAEPGPTAITATIDRAVFIQQVSTSTTITLQYITDWNADPEDYGVTVTGTPVAGDTIVITYAKENRGTITTANPTRFISTGWNLFNYAAGNARVINYSDEFGFMISGTYTRLEFSPTLSGVRQTITPINGYFVVPGDGYVFVTGGNDTDTAIWMTWSDWVDEANGGVFEPYEQSTIDLAGLMVNFPDGLMKVDNVYDEINFNTQRAYSRIEKMDYTDENLASVIASGVPYDTDQNYIYAVKEVPDSYLINVDGEYNVSDHGLEMFIGTSVPLTASSLYGNDLKAKLRRDVITISQQTLTDEQKRQVRENIGAASKGNVIFEVSEPFNEGYVRVPGLSDYTLLLLEMSESTTLLGVNLGSALNGSMSFMKYNQSIGLTSIASYGIFNGDTIMIDGQHRGFNPDSTIDQSNYQGTVEHGLIRITGVL